MESAGSEYTSGVHLQDKPFIADGFSLDEDEPATAGIGWSVFLEPEHLENGIETRLYYGSDFRYDLGTDSCYSIEAAWQGEIPAGAILEPSYTNTTLATPACSANRETHGRTAP